MKLISIALKMKTAVSELYQMRQYGNKQLSTFLFSEGPVGNSAIYVKRFGR